MRTLTTQSAMPRTRSRGRDALLATLTGWWRGVQIWRRRRATVRALSGLSDHALRDIGLDRSEIDRVARSVTESRRTFGYRM